MLSKQALGDFKVIWCKQFGEEISDEKAAEEAVNLLTLVDAVYRPIKKEWLEELKEKDKNPSP